MVKSAAIVLGAGKGTRMKSDMPKVMHQIAGRPMIAHVTHRLQDCGIEKICCVIGPDMDALSDFLAPLPCAVQKDRLGTAHAVLAAKDHMSDFDGPVLIAYGDTPLISKATFNAMLDAADDQTLVVLGFRPEDPGAYGRLVQNETGELEAIIEFKDADEKTRALNLCNSGVMCVPGSVLFDLLKKVSNDNAAGEYYLTDLVALARADGMKSLVVEGREEELLGVNSRLELARAEQLLQEDLRAQAMINGATLIDPESVIFSHDTVLGRDVIVEPHVFFGPNVRIGDGVHIKAFSHFEECRVGEHSVLGPYARLRPGADLKEGVKIGNFVEIKKAVIEPGAKVNHLSYIGDAHIGAEANIGAGTITCNYDGFFKYKTKIGAGAFIGSNTALVAPVTIGEKATIGAGSTISTDVASGDLGLTRAQQTNLENWSTRFREAKSIEKKSKAT